MTMTMKLLTASGVLIASSVQAQSVYPIEGSFVGSGEGQLSLRTLVMDSQKGIVAASATTGSTGCAGAISGIGRFSGGTLQFTSYTKDEGADQCVVTVVFDKTGKQGRMTEANCTFYHGAACAFDGRLRKQK